MDKKLKEKLRKLKAIIDDAGASQGEIENAGAMMQKLLMKHNLTESSLDLSTGDIKEDPLQTIGGKNDGPWQGQLAVTISSNNLCSVFFTRTGAGAHQGIITFVGTEDNVELVQEQFQILRGKFLEYVKQEVKKAKRGATGGSFNPNKFKRDFLRGCVTGLSDKYDSQQSEYGTSSGEYGLMVRKHSDIIKEYLDEKHNLSRGRRTRVRNGDGFQKGRITGNRASTQRALN